jgi:hypothetical protein
MYGTVTVLSLLLLFIYLLAVMVMVFYVLYRRFLHKNVKIPYNSHSFVYVIIYIPSFRSVILSMTGCYSKRTCIGPRCSKSII